MDQKISDLDSIGMPNDWPFQFKNRDDLLDHKTRVGRWLVSTVELRIMIDLGDAYPYETMIFDDETGDTDVIPQLAKRHQTAEEALAYHSFVVGELQAQVDAYEIVKRGQG